MGPARSASAAIALGPSAWLDVYQMLGHTMVGEFDLKKTFAWGGIYGAATSMEDIESTFADGVAAAVTGQKEEPPKQKTSDRRSPVCIHQ